MIADGREIAFWAPPLFITHTDSLPAGNQSQHHSNYKQKPGLRPCADVCLTPVDWQLKLLKHDSLEKTAIWSRHVGLLEIIIGCF